MDRLVYQVQWGNGAIHSDDVLEGLEWCSKSVQDYCDRLKSDYQKFYVPDQEHVLLQKFLAIKPHINDYDDFLFIDLDVHIAPRAEFVIREADLQVKLYRIANSLTCEPDGTPIMAQIVPPVNYPNSGVMLVSQRLMKQIIEYIESVDLDSLPHYCTGIDEGILYDFMHTEMKYGDFLELPYKYNSMVLYPHQINDDTQLFRHFCGPEGKELLKSYYK